jgi:hypothetical protein
MGAAESQVRLLWCQARCAESILAFHYILIVVAAARASYYPRSENQNPLDCSMQQSEFDRINAALDRAEFALEALRKKAVELERKRVTSKSPKDILVMNLEAAEIMQQLQKISDTVHASNPAPHLRLVSDTE